MAEILNPQDAELEEVILGACLIGREAMPMVADRLRPEMFYFDKNALIYAAMQVMYREGRQIDIITVKNELVARGKLDAAGGPYELTRISGRVASAVHLEYHVLILREKYLRREMILGFHKLLALAADETTDIGDTLVDAHNLLDRLEGECGTIEHLRDMDTLMDDTLQQVDARQASGSNGVTGISTGLADLDRLTSGWQRGDLNVIAARPAVGKTAFAAVNLIMPLPMLLGTIGFMLGTGGSAIVGITLGEGDQKKADRYFTLFLLAALVSVSVLAVLGIVFLRPIAVLLGAKGELLDYAVRYGRILMVSLPTFALQNMFQSFFVTAEKPHLGFWFTVGAGCTNMVLDVLMVGIWGWGVEGAAIATFISQLVGGVLPVFYFIDRSNSSRLHLCKTSFYSKVLRDACINGSSELMTNLSMSLVNILYNYQLLRLAGENGVAAYGVIMYAAFLFVAVFVGYAVGSAPIVSFHYGARNHAEVHNLYRKSLRLIAVVAVTLTLASMFIIPCVARIFVGYDAELLALTSRAFRLYALSFLIMGFNVYASSFFTALGDGVTSALISFLRTLAFQVIAILLLPLLLGIDGIWLAVTAAELAALAVSAAMLLTKDKVFHYRKA